MTGAEALRGVAVLVRRRSILFDALPALEASLCPSGMCASQKGTQLPQPARYSAVLAPLRQTLLQDGGCLWRKQLEPFQSSGCNTVSRGFAKAARKPAEPVPSAAATDTPGSSQPTQPERKREGKLKQAARVQTFSPDMQTGRNLKITAVSPNLLAEPYKGEPPKLAWSDYLKREGWKERWKRLLGGAKSVYTVAKCRRYLPNFTLFTFKQDVLRVYKDTCRMLAQGDRSGLKQLVTPGEYSNFKRQLRAREDGGWKRVEWSLVEEPHLRQLELLHARLMSYNPKDDSSAFAQMTVRLRCRHRFAAYNAAGKLVAGSPDSDFPVQDVWVFERTLQNSPISKWRVAGRLGGIPPTPQLAPSMRDRFTSFLFGNRAARQIAPS